MMGERKINAYSKSTVQMKPNTRQQHFDLSLLLFELALINKEKLCIKSAFCPQQT